MITHGARALESFIGKLKSLKRNSSEGVFTIYRWGGGGDGGACYGISSARLVDIRPPITSLIINNGT